MVADRAGISGFLSSVTHDDARREPSWPAHRSDAARRLRAGRLTSSPLTSAQGERLRPLFSSISVQLNGLFMISQSHSDFWRFHRDAFAFCFGFLVEVGRNLSVSSFR